MRLLSIHLQHYALALLPCFSYVFFCLITAAVLFHGDNFASGQVLGAKTVIKTFGYKWCCLYEEDMRKTQSVNCFYHSVCFPSSIFLHQRRTVNDVPSFKTRTVESDFFFSFSGTFCVQNLNCA